MKNEADGEVFAQVNRYVDQGNNGREGFEDD